MTDNDAAKALEDVNAWIASIEWCKDTGDTFRYKDSEDVLYHHAKTIRTALTKSAKVDGLLDALNKITRVKTLPDHSLNTFNLTTVHLIANEAIQRFNGEV